MVDYCVVYVDLSAEEKANLDVSMRALDPIWDSYSDSEKQASLDTLCALSKETTGQGSWPWPFSLISDWLNGLWNWISEAAMNAGRWLWTAVSNGLTLTRDQLFGRIDWFWGQSTDQFSLIGKRLSDIGAWIWNQVWNGLTLTRDQLLARITWSTEQNTSGFSLLSKNLGDSVAWLWTQIWNGLSLTRDQLLNRIAWSDGVNAENFDRVDRHLDESVAWLRDSVRTMFDGALDMVTGWIKGVLDGLFKILSQVLTDFWTWLMGGLSWIAQMIIGAVNTVVAAVQRFVMDLGRQLLDTLTGIFTPGSPDKEVQNTMAVMVETMNNRVVDEIKAMYKSPPDMGTVIATAGTVATLLGVGILSVKVLASAADAAHPTKDIGFKDIAGSMIAATGASMAMSSLLMMPAQIGLLTPLRHAYNQMFTPEIPGSGDLVRMVVREAFDPNMVIKAPAEFVGAMKFQGFSEVWSDRYWTAHFEPIALGQAYANLWRGLWKKEQFMYALHIADIHPMWREDIYNVAFRAPSARELGYGFDVGEYSVEDIEKFRRWGGLSEEDAKKAARSMVAYRTEAEREALRREAISDFQAWLDDESQLRVNLKAIGGRDEVIDLWVARAEYRRVRDFTLAMVKISTDQHYKGIINDTRLEQDLIELGITPEGRSKILAEAKSRRLKAVKEETAAKKKVMPESRVRQARDLGLIGDKEYMSRLLDHDWTEEDARLDLAIELTPKPVTPEEIERRKLTVTSKRNRAVRRYDSTLARLQDQIDLTALQIDDTEKTMAESLDIIDAQIAAVEEDLAVAPPEKVAALEQRRLILMQRRELQVTRWESRIRALTEQHKNLLETRDLAVKQRDEELGEYDAELRLLEVAS